MKEIIKKLKERKDKEIMISIFNELITSLRHIENIIIALLTFLIALPTLFKMLEIKLELAIIFFSFFGLFAGIGSYIRYSKTEKLLKELMDMIAEDPMDKKDIEILKDTIYWLILIISAFILGILIYFS